MWIEHVWHANPERTQNANRRKRKRRDGQAGKLHTGADSTWQSTRRLDQLSSPVLVPWCSLMFLGGMCLCNFVYDPFFILFHPFSWCSFCLLVIRSIFHSASFPGCRFILRSPDCQHLQPSAGRKWQAGKVGAGRLALSCNQSFIKYFLQLQSRKLTLGFFWAFMKPWSLKVNQLKLFKMVSKWASSCICNHKS